MGQERTRIIKLFGELQKCKRWMKKCKLVDGCTHLT